MASSYVYVAKSILINRKEDFHIVNAQDTVCMNPYHLILEKRCWKVD